MSNKAENNTYWDSIYLERQIEQFNPRDWRNAATVNFLEKISEEIKPKIKVLEIGGGGGQLSCYLAKKHPESYFSILDFSKEGCIRAEKMANLEGVNIAIYNIDFFSCDKSMENKFDLLFSLGVVEHFKDLGYTIKKMGFYLNKNGLIFTLIPNMESPIYYYLCRKWNREVLETHILYNLNDLIEWHKKAGFKVIKSGYIYPLEFSILSMAFSDKPKTGTKWLIFLWLTRLSKVVHLLNKFCIKLPTSRLFSPYIFVLGEKIN